MDIRNAKLKLLSFPWPSEGVAPPHLWTQGIPQVRSTAHLSQHSSRAGLLSYLPTQILAQSPKPGKCPIHIKQMLSFLPTFYLTMRAGTERSGAQKKNGRKGLGAGKSSWWGCGPPAQQLGKGEEDCVESWSVSIRIIALSHWLGSLVYLVHRAKQSPGER